MTDTLPPAEPDPRQPEPAPPQPEHTTPRFALPGAALGWALITALTAIAIVSVATAGADAEDGAPDAIGVLVARMQARYAVGAASVLPQSGDDMTTIVRELETGTLPQRLGTAAVLAELGGPEAGLESLQRTRAAAEKAEHPWPDDLRRATGLMERLWRARAEGHTGGNILDPGEQETLRGTLGWFGDLALAEDPPGDAPPPHPDLRREVLRDATITFAAMVTAVVLFGLLLVGGLAGLLVLVVLAVMGRMRVHLRTGSPAGVWAEAFAVWMLLFTVGSKVLGDMTGSGITAVLIAGPLSLVAVGWPVLRGLPWKQVREEVGWTLGPRPLLEPGFAVAGYAMTMPLLAIGILLTLGLAASGAGSFGAGGGDGAAEHFGGTGGPAHPIIQWLAAPDWGRRLLILLAAAVVAPVVEETAFRGLLYRHLREVTRAAPWAVSVLFGAVLNALIFAAIHPQGVVAVPVLAALAFGFTLLREWRGTLVPSMIAHGLNNLAVTLLIIFAAGD